MKRERIIEALKICDSNYDGVVCKKCPIKDEDYNGSWYDKDGDCYQHLMREAAELLSEQSAIQPEERTEKRTETHACDLISRQAAIDAIHNLYAIHGSEGSWIDQKDAFNAVNNLPPAKPEPKKGKWIKNDNGTYSCSLCHSWIPEEQYYYAQFCLYCGADMRGEPNETD